MEGAGQAPAGGGYLPIGEQGNLVAPPGSSEPRLPGPRPSPSPTPALQTLTDPGGTEGWAPSRPEERQQGDALALGGGVAGAGGEGSPQGPLPRLWRGGPQLIQNRGSPGVWRKDRCKRRGRAGEGKKGKGENGGEKGREEGGRSKWRGRREERKRER